MRPCLLAAGLLWTVAAAAQTAAGPGPVIARHHMAATASPTHNHTHINTHTQQNEGRKKI